MTDPSTTDGSRVIFEREVVLELRKSDAPQEAGIQEAVIVKILLKENDGVPSAVTVELTSENDLFFHFSCHVERSTYPELQEAQGLMVDFGEFPGVLVKMFNQTIKEPRNYLSVFFVSQTGEGRLEFVSNMSWLGKYVEILALDFVASPLETVRSHIAYRYSMLRARASMLQSSLTELKGLIKVKLPSLHMQLERSAGGPGKM
eukprot:gnl/Dysnectes_brevis/3022_a3733_1549.p1 GENE.gnl/Dysnectes_brevis/3022_a3733_1549~~gnl/Dysnectes_brevis/3022_a3733_1549.p1  ORF type:complete len:203 (-),score=53.22 gnl/Dysnectes_brevis/3022_a3733_1549:38-646(-)